MELQREANRNMLKDWTSTFANKISFEVKDIDRMVNEFGQCMLQTVIKKKKKLHLVEHAETKL